jgi:hypothetical protein
MNLVIKETLEIINLACPLYLTMDNPDGTSRLTKIVCATWSNKVAALPTLWCVNLYEDNVTKENHYDLLTFAKSTRLPLSARVLVPVHAETLSLSHWMPFLECPIDNRKSQKQMTKFSRLLLDSRVAHLARWKRARALLNECLSNDVTQYILKGFIVD